MHQGDQVLRVNEDRMVKMVLWALKGVLVHRYQHLHYQYLVCSVLVIGTSWCTWTSRCTRNNWTICMLLMVF